MRLTSLFNLLSSGYNLYQNCQMPLDLEVHFDTNTSKTFEVNCGFSHKSGLVVYICVKCGALSQRDTICFITSLKSRERNNMRERDIKLSLFFRFASSLEEWCIETSCRFPITVQVVCHQVDEVEISIQYVYLHNTFNHISVDATLYRYLEYTLFIVTLLR